MRQAHRVLFISPVMPAEGGHGLAMRAGMFLEALAAEQEVSVLVVPVAGPADPGAIPSWVARQSVRVVVMPPGIRSDSHFELISRVVDPGARAKALLAYPRPLMCRFATAENVAEAARRVGAPFDLIHVCRLYMAPFAAPFLDEHTDRPPIAVLDLDDDEPRTHRRLGTLHAQRGRVETAMIEAGEAGKYERAEREWLSRFARVLVCSEVDRAALVDRLPAERIAVIPNAVRPSEEPAPRPADRELSVLLVGSFGYFANEDGALFFGEEVWPRVFAEAPRPVRALFVGSRPGPAVLGLGRLPGVTVTGPVPSVTPYYARSDVAINPIRGGGGTRIKAIEAFAHGVPLVSTSVGAEGLAVEHGRHLLIADTADDFARACLRLLREPALGRALAERARALYRERYALPQVSAQIRALYRALALTAHAE